MGDTTETGDVPVASEQFEDDPVVVALDVQKLPRSEFDGSTLTLSPDRATAIGAALMQKAADYQQRGAVDNYFTDDDEGTDK